jgi:hypothetical protein
VTDVNARDDGRYGSNAECPKRHKMEAEAMFPGVDVSDLLVVPTCQVRAKRRRRSENRAKRKPIETRGETDEKMRLTPMIRL